MFLWRLCKICPFKCVYIEPTVIRSGTFPFHPGCKIYPEPWVDERARNMLFYVFLWMKQHAVFLNPQCVSRSILRTLPSCCFPELATGAGWSRFWLMQKCQGRQTRWFLSVVPLKKKWLVLPTGAIYREVWSIFWPPFSVKHSRFHQVGAGMLRNKNENNMNIYKGPHVSTKWVI